MGTSRKKLEAGLPLPVNWRTGAALFQPLYPRKQTCAVQLGMSAKCQKRTFIQGELSRGSRRNGKANGRLTALVSLPYRCVCRLDMTSEPLGVKKRITHTVLRQLYP